jgi:peptide/nickel transport system permease protein
MKTLAGRVFRAIVLTAAASFFSFLLLTFAPGDFLTEIRLNPQLSQETVAALRSQYGLDRGLLERYALWLGAVASGSWGVSFSYNCPVSTLLWDRAANTLLLTGTALTFTWPLALALGTWFASCRSRSWLQAIADAATTALLSIPELVLSLALLLFAARTGLFPVGGMSAPGAESIGDLIRHLVLPVFCLVAASLPVVTAHVRASLAGVLDSTFIRAGRAHGIGNGRLLFKHGLLAAANPLISLFGISTGNLLSGSLIVEAVMSWPGLGRLLLDAIMARDVHVVIGAVVVTTLFAMAGTLIADALLVALDHRIRKERSA